MMFYRVSYSDGGVSAGFTWHTSQDDALASARADYDQNPAEYRNIPPAPGLGDRVEQITIKPTKAGILDALKRYASHPDNG